MAKINVITLCSGYDSQCMALKRLHLDYELVAWSEIDKYACMAHDAVFPEWAGRNVGDMTKVDWSQFADKQIDLLTYSTPCQDISNAGKQAGLKKGSDTRSGILWYTEEAIRILRPKYLMQENVKALVSKKFLPDFLEWCKVVEGYSYTNYYKVLNAKDYGVPQNRERVFMISVRDDIDKQYTFPQPWELDTFLCDKLEQQVDESYYLDDEKISTFQFDPKFLKEIESHEEET